MTRMYNVMRAVNEPEAERYGTLGKVAQQHHGWRTLWSSR